MSARERMLNKTKRRYRSVTTEADTWWLRSLSQSEIRAFYASCRNSKGDLKQTHDERFQELVLAQSLVEGEGGERSFTDKDILDGVLDDVDARVVIALSRAVRQFTGIEEDDDFVAIGDAVKNSQSTRENSGSGVSPPDMVVST